MAGRRSLHAVRRMPKRRSRFPRQPCRCHFTKHKRLGARFNLVMTHMKQKLLWLVLALASAVHAATGTAEAGNPPVLQPNAQETRAALLAAQVLTRYHYKAIPLDDALSGKIFDRYLQALDPERMHFLQSDIDAVAASRTQLDDAILSQDLRAPFAIFNLYLRRTAERLAFARALLPNGFDFKTDESMRIDRKNQPRPSSEAQLHDLWRKHAKNDWLRLKLAGTGDSDIVRILDKRYDNAAKRMGKISSSDAFETFMNAYTMSIEPHTNYLGPRAAEDFDIAMRLSLVGIGAVLLDNEGYATIRELVPGGPASASGLLKAGDRIVGVAQGAAGVMEDVVGWRLDDTVALIRGKADSTVRLDILSSGIGADASNKTVTLIRSTITLQDQAAKARVFGVTEGNKKRKVGVITLPSFYEDVEARVKGVKDYRSASRDVARLLTDMKAQKVDSLLIDLRDNGGGSLREAIELTGLFVGKVPVVQARNANGEVSVEKNTEVAVAWSGPVGVMINRSSASASEIFAAAIQDYGRGLIMGESSFGKGTVQTITSLDEIARNVKPAYGELKMTIAQFFRVNGGTTQLRGVTPDIGFPGLVAAEEFGESSFDNALPWTQIKPATYVIGSNAKVALPTLRTLHENRIRRDKDFQNLQEVTARAQTMRKNNVISLNEVARRKDRDQQDKQLAAMQSAAGAVAGKPSTSGLADDGLQSNERKLSADIATKKTRDALKDVWLNEGVAILSDAIALQQGKPRMASNQTVARPVVVTELPVATVTR